MKVSHSSVTRCRPQTPNEKYATRIDKWLPRELNDAQKPGPARMVQRKWTGRIFQARDYPRRDVYFAWQTMQMNFRVDVRSSACVASNYRHLTSFTMKTIKREFIVCGTFIPNLFRIVIYLFRQMTTFSWFIVYLLF